VTVTGKKTPLVIAGACVATAALCFNWRGSNFPSVCASFAHAARYYVFDHIAGKIPDSQLPHELRDLRRHGTSRTIQ